MQRILIEVKGIGSPSTAAIREYYSSFAPYERRSRSDPAPFEDLPAVGLMRCFCVVLRPAAKWLTIMALWVGERGRNRTFNLLIKSQLLCQLSYAPVSGLSFCPGDPPICRGLRAIASCCSREAACRNHLISGLQTTSTNITQGIAAAPTRRQPAASLRGDSVRSDLACYSA
jgi:hypothetical protein